MKKTDRYRVDDVPYSDNSDYKDPAFSKTPKQEVKAKRPWIKIAIIVAVVLIAIGGTLYAISHKPSKPQKHISGQTIVQVPSSTITASPTNYVSNGSDLNLSFTYPDNWSVTPRTNDNESDQTITVTSPLTTVVNADNSSVVGKVVVQVRPGSDTASELNSNSPITSLASTQIEYSNPTANQIVYPFISFIHFNDGSKESGVFEEVMITGGLSFSAGQSISAEDVSGLDPIISANFYQCATQSCTGSSRSFLSINLSTWQNATIFQQVLTMFESFQLN